MSADCLPPKPTVRFEKPDGNPPEFKDLGTVENRELPVTDDYHELYDDLITDIEWVLWIIIDRYVQHPPHIS